ncbi:molybdopterin-guanine dinucleotide biosynthesis protein B [Elusimicrobiota bacterium]
MLIVSFVADSETGKTTIITRLAEELTKRGHRVGCIKHCPRGFDLDHPGKDSYQFKKAGAYGVVVHSPDRIGLVRTTPEPVTPVDLAVEFFMDADFVLIEGYKEFVGGTKIELLRKGVSEKPKHEGAAAIIADFEIETGKLVLRSDDIDGIIGFLTDLKEKEGEVISVKVNDENLPLNPFAQSMIKSTVLGLLEPLKRKSGAIKKIDVKLEV